MDSDSINEASTTHPFEEIKVTKRTRGNTKKSVATTKNAKTPSKPPAKKSYSAKSKELKDNMSITTESTKESHTDNSAVSSVAKAPKKSEIVRSMTFAPKRGVTVNDSSQWFTCFEPANDYSPTNSPSYDQTYIQEQNKYISLIQCAVVGLPGCTSLAIRFRQKIPDPNFPYEPGNAEKYLAMAIKSKAEWTRRFAFDNSQAWKAYDPTPGVESYVKNKRDWPCRWFPIRINNSNFTENNCLSGLRKMVEHLNAGRKFTICELDENNCWTEGSFETRTRWENLLDTEQCFHQIWRMAQVTPPVESSRMAKGWFKRNETVIHSVFYPESIVGDIAFKLGWSNTTTCEDPPGLPALEFGSDQEDNNEEADDDGSL
jgi:hypothetical protein